MLVLLISTGMSLTLIHYLLYLTLVKQYMCREECSNKYYRYRIKEFRRGKIINYVIYRWHLFYPLRYRKVGYPYNELQTCVTIARELIEKDKKLGDKSSRWLSKKDLMMEQL